MSFKNYIWLIGFVFILSSCHYPPLTTTTQQVHSPLQGLSLSITNDKLYTCIFHPGYKILHFPMWHYPTEGKITANDYDITVKSQFQLLHTILAYKNANVPIAVFDEHVTQAGVNAELIKKLQNSNTSEFRFRPDGSKIDYRADFQRAYHAFGGGIPQAYEHLNVLQKELLFELGGSLILFFLQQIPEIHQVIQKTDFNTIINLENLGTSNNYYRYNFREEKLTELVHLYLIKNPAAIIFIAYGVSHDFSDNFAHYHFQSGLPCLDWAPPAYQNGIQQQQQSQQQQYQQPQQ